MNFINRLITTFDRLLLPAFGCGVLMLCGIIAWGVLIINNLNATPSTLPNGFTDSPSQATLHPLTPLSTDQPVSTSQTVPSLIPSLNPLFNNTPPTGKIAFACYINQVDQICLINADGSERKQLTDFEATAFYPSISPDGQTVYFSSKRTGSFEIYSIDLNGENRQRLTREIGSLYAPELSPNGEWVLFTNHGNGLWLIKPNGDNPHSLTDRDDIDPTWSPDGSMIAFASSRAGMRQLFVMNADGSNIRQVTNLDNMGGRSTWSPDGTRLAFYRGPAGDHNIYIINIDGTGLVQLTNGGDNLGPSWSPDGNWIAFTSFRDGNNEIYLIHPDGTNITRLTDSPISDWQPRWGR